MGEILLTCSLIFWIIALPAFVAAYSKFKKRELIRDYYEDLDNEPK